MKIKIFLIALIIAIFGFCIFKILIAKKPNYYSMQPTNQVKITPISHASLALNWSGRIIYADPVGDPADYGNLTKPDIVLITHEHQDHFNTNTLIQIIKPETILIVPKAVADKLPEALKHNLIILKNGDTANQLGINIEAIPAYNLREADKNKHAQGNGNGYVLSADNQRVYIAGDTEDIPEMRALKNIDIAFVPMNLPYTMSVEKAAEAVLTFKPKQVYPYHYRTPSGFSDVAKFKQLVNESGSDIAVIQLNWYPQP